MSTASSTSNRPLKLRADASHLHLPTTRGDIVLFKIQVWQPDAETVDRFRLWGWTPALPELNDSLKNTVVFTTTDLALAEASFSDVDWWATRCETAEPEDG